MTFILLSPVSVAIMAVLFNIPAFFPNPIIIFVLCIYKTYCYTYIICNKNDLYLQQFFIYVNNNDQTEHMVRLVTSLTLYIPETDNEFLVITVKVTQVITNQTNLEDVVIECCNNVGPALNGDVQTLLPLHYNINFNCMCTFTLLNMIY